MSREDRLEAQCRLLLDLHCADCRKRAGCGDCQLRAETIKEIERQDVENEQVSKEVAVEQFTKARGNRIFAKKSTQCRMWEISEDPKGDFETIQDAIRWIAQESGA
jgi:hypothetical protein